ncbi:nucleotidyltransferase family protein [Acinetobacter sp.]|uniref:nucleotidyltransferase family protein n=1 Tax=Acinetobacter sp. TaxID=472 RepID=UPI000C3DE783|nr:nucleotidyltransferase family protein [Acinetobacter sp.]MBC70323.1 hypothetical protein [Acinetobacter sp.]
MKCILLSAGKGERLLPYTKKLPKCMIDLGGINLIEFWLKKVSLQDFDEIIINSHHHSEILKKEILKITNKLSLKNVKVTFEEKLLGTAGTLWSLKDNLNDDFFVINTDVYANIDLESMRSAFFEKNLLCLIATDFREDTKGCGKVVFNSEFKIKQFSEKDHDNKPGFVYSGILIFSKKIFEFLPFKEFISQNYTGLDTGYDVFPKILNFMGGHKLENRVIDLRDEEKLFELKRYILKKGKL